MIWKTLFWLSCFLVFYNYAGYAILVYIMNKLRGRKKKAYSADFYPTVSFIVAAFNEEDCIEKKIINSLSVNYPSEKIEFIFITDGSSDGTMDTIRKYPSIQLLHKPERNGKTAAVNRAVEHAKNDILIFSDANTILNEEAVLNIARHYYDKKTGGVAGEKKVLASSEGTDQVGSGEGLYWKYESFLKQLDSDFYSVVGAAGELFSLRRELYQPVPRNVILDDFIISMWVTLKRYRIVYEPNAYAMELPSFSISDEHKRKVRIAAGGFQSIVMLKPLFLFWKHFRLSFLYFSHRVFRWTLSPLCLILAFVTNFVLIFISNEAIYQWLFAAQVAFYIMALVPTMFSSDSKVFKVFKLAYYFVFMNASVVQGFFRFLRGKQPAAWEKAKRNQPAMDVK
jgi:cellulose synthase/poly-beta-1,6-N-acetylglucosamine synthase-like glycosyltransferase